MQLSQRELLLRFKNRPTTQINLDYEGLLQRIFGPGFDGVSRGPTKTQRKYLESPQADKAFKGMAGVAKTSAGCASMLLRAMFQPNFKGFIGRHDYNDLVNTTAVRFFEMVNRVNPELIIDRDKTPPMTVYINQPGGIGIATINFIGLKDYPGSWDWHRGFIDEADECERSIVETIKTRCRSLTTPEYTDDYGVDMAFNPPDKNHWIYQACTGLDENDRKVADPTFVLFEPEYGENDVNLPPDYTTKRFKGLTHDELERLKFGNWGSSFKGEGVFKDHFHTQSHVVDHIPYDPIFPIVVFLDFGFRSPYACYNFLDHEHRLNTIGELPGKDTEVREYIRQVKADLNTKFPHRPGTLYIGDPAAKQKKDTGSTLQVLDSEGINLMYMEGMSIEEGLRRIRYLLQQAPKGIMQIRISRKGCPRLIRMFQGGYHKHKTTNLPVKDGVYDHPADAFRYGITNLFDAEGTSYGLPTWETKATWGASSVIPSSLAP